MRNNWDDRVEMEAQGSRELLAQMVEMLGRQRFIEIEGIEERVIQMKGTQAQIILFGLTSGLKKN